MEHDYPLLNTPNLVALILREADAGMATAEGCADRLAGLFGGEPPVDRDSLLARCARHARWLGEAGLIEPRDGGWRLTDRGRDALSAHPNGMDLDALAAFPRFAAYLDARDAAERPQGGRPARATAYDEGFAARNAGAAFTDNPYDFSSADHGLWEKGWCEALDEAEGPGVSPITGGRRDTN